jgi:hypothetical protein
MDVVVQNRFQIPPAQAGAILDGYKKYAIPMEMARYEPPLHHGIVLEEAILSVSYLLESRRQVPEGLPKMQQRCQSTLDSLMDFAGRSAERAAPGTSRCDFSFSCYQGLFGIWTSS